ncbi:mitogen-activated protein kinase kinase kinase 3-like isoform X1 [Triticum dicoccoides]|uniref:mitogen-activated protein kinase kinase kinase 3-like isoform X1 n=1 Tax=Triticum dicoccoides TaxID=85692 RepID=UPI00188F5485|nr:mitogen-activated protein kinase kinase kinase 3-like isoform X1 [Triticum dicoccoides]
MPAWWKGKGRSKSKAPAPAGDAGTIPAVRDGEKDRKNKKATSFDEALIGREGRGKQLQQPAPAVGHPLPRPAFMPSASAPASASASASSGGSSSLGSSAASDEPLDLGIYRISDANRTPAIDSRKQSLVLEEGRFVVHNLASENNRSCEPSVSPRKEFQSNILDLPSDRTTYCHGRKSTEIVFATRMPSSPPSSRGKNCPTSPVHSRAFGQCPGSPTAWQEDARSSSSPHPLPLPPGSPCTSSRSLHSQWKKGKLLGSGTFGQVYLGFNSEGGQMCAIKEVKVIADDSNSKECLRQLNQEMLLLNQLSHPNIVQYYGSELSSETLSVYLEFVSGGSIHKLLQEYGPFGEAILRKYTAQILSGLAYLHGRNTVHRDIKGANILVDPNGDIKLADFGMAKHISAYTSIKSFKGSPYWMAPEVIMNTNGYSLSVDIWSLGCTILEMATARPPWSQYEGVAAIFKIGNSKDIPDIPDHLSSEAKSFLKLCLQRDPAARPTAAQLIEHPWVKDQASVRSSRSGSGITRDMFSTSTDGSKATVKTSIELSSYRSLSPLRDTNLRMRNLVVPASSIPSISTRRASAISASNVRMNMSLPVSPCTSPLRQYRQSNRSCLPSPPHPAYSAGAANYSPINNVLYPTRPSNYLTDPWLETPRQKTQTFDSPRRL